MAHTSSMIIWVAAFVAGAVGLLLAAVAGMPWTHAAIALATIGFVVLTALRDNRSAIESGAGRAQLASRNARFIGTIWCWAALSILIMYGTGVLHWREWLTFVIGCVVAAGLSLFLSSLLRGEESNSPVARLARGFGALQAVGMVATIGGLWLDGKLLRFTREDWGAHNVFLFGALGILVITLIAFDSERKGKPG